MSLISGKEAMCKAIDGDDVEYKVQGDRDWCDFNGESWSVDELKSSDIAYRIKPRTITLNGIELNPCYALGIDRIKNEVSIQFQNNSDADKLHDLLAKLYGFKG